MDNVMKLMKTDKAQCSGCYACCNICPVDAIRMKVNEEGFWYPSVDETVCIHCGRCIQVCQIDNSKPPKVDMDTEAYACINLDNGKRLASSSGGIFIELSQYVISHDGIVFGAAFDKHLKLRHTFASTMEECRALWDQSIFRVRSADRIVMQSGSLIKRKWSFYRNALPDSWAEIIPGQRVCKSYYC